MFLPMALIYAPRVVLSSVTVTFILFHATATLILSVFSIFPPYVFWKSSKNPKYLIPEGASDPYIRDPHH